MKYIRNFFLHIGLVTRHKWLVLLHCVRCGILWRGIVHDLSKFSPTELIESVKYYQGNRSPIGVCRRETGVSKAWLHHKGRNKHHPEYWLDNECSVQPVMPYKYIVECICDKLAATKVYNGRNYDRTKPLEHWHRHASLVDANPMTKAFIERVFTDLMQHGEKYILRRKYLRAVYAEIVENKS